MRGRPSVWWREGQDRRFAVIEGASRLDGARVLDLGCGLGAYTRCMAASGAHAVGLEIEQAHATRARAGGTAVAMGVGERLPFASGSLDLVLLHEVLEHVADDRATMSEVARVLAPGGRAIVFVPNRLWPFETHGVYWRGRYHFGNAPLVNYLPDPLRNRLAPHVRIYTARSLRSACAGLGFHEVSLHQMYPGYDKLAASRPRAGGALSTLSRRLEATPLAVFGLSHVLVLERDE